MGLSGVYLFGREFSNLVDMMGAAPVRIPGAGAGEASIATVVNKQLLSMGPVLLDSQTVFVSQSERTQGWSFDGVIGRSLLAYHTLELLVGTGRPFSPPEEAEEEPLCAGLSGEIRGWRGTSHRLGAAGFPTRPHRGCDESPG
jgi:hypothetical protein